MLRILFAGISDLLSVDIPLGTIFSYQTAVDQMALNLRSMIEKACEERGCRE
jgi:hypothetical protein